MDSHAIDDPVEPRISPGSTTASGSLRYTGPRAFAFLTWTSQLGGAPVRVAMEARLLRKARITVNGASVYVPKPTPAAQHRELPLSVSGADVVAALQWTVQGTALDVFVDGRSVVDGRTLESARQRRDEPAGVYEVVFGRASVAWPVIVGATGFGTVFNIQAFVASGSSFEQAVTAGAAGFLFVNLWCYAMRRVHRTLLRHPGSSDPGRFLAMTCAVLAPPVIAYLALALTSGALI